MGLRRIWLVARREVGRSAGASRGRRARQGGADPRRQVGQERAAGHESGAGPPPGGAGPAAEARSAAERRRLRARALSLASAVAPFGLAFGAVCSEAGLSPVESVGFSTLVFTGGSQFAAVAVLRDGGAAPAAIAAGWLLALRLLAFGIVMAPVLGGSILRRAALAHLMIDESMALGTASEDPTIRRYGYLWAGLSVFVVWNLTTILGRALIGDSESSVSGFGLDATVPAAFLALLWPRLRSRDQRAVAAAGALIAVSLVPVSAPGVPVVAAAAGVLAARPRAGRSE